MNQSYLHDKLGPHIQSALLDNAVTEVMLNPDGQLWCKSREEGTQAIGHMSPLDAMSFVHALSQSAGQFLNESKPYFDGVLPFNNERINITIPPIAAGVSFNIRKQAQCIYSLNDYLDKKIITPNQVSILKAAVAQRKNILVSGGPGSGKTTFTNAILQEIVDYAEPGHRLLLLEQVVELQCALPNHKRLLTTESVNMQRLLWIAMRNTPDRIVVGEVRDGAALDLLKAWNTGCPGGIATIHANSALAAIQRLKDLVLEAASCVPYSLISESIDMIVHIGYSASHQAGRVVEEIIGLNHFDQSVQSFEIEKLA